MWFVLMIVVISVITAVLTTILLILKRNASYWRNRNIPHEEPSLLFGNLKGTGTKVHFSEVFREKYLKLKNRGPFAGFHMFFGVPVALLLDLDLIKNVLIKDFSNFTDRGLFCNEKDDPLTGHLFLLDGKKWKDLRHKISPTFTSGKMKFMYPTIVEVANRFSEVFGKMVTQDSIVEIKELLARFTTDVIGTCAFGIDCNSLMDPNAKFRVMGKKSFTEMRYGNVGNIFVRSCPELAKKLRLKFILDDVSEFFLGAVRETVEFREKNNIERNDFMNMLIELKNKKVTHNENGEEISGMTLEELAAQAFVFFLAGFETSSTTMGFCLYELALNQEIQDKIRSEIDAVLQEFNEELTYECLQKLTYLDQVINETLRKYSVVPVLFRKAGEDYKVPNTDLIIEKNTQVLIPADAIHHDPEIYPEPSKFDPDRFTHEEIQKRHPCAWLPFGDGPRNCIGLRFGKMQARIGLVVLLKQFRFLVSPQTQIPLNIDPAGLVLGSKGGIHLKVERI